MSNRTAAFAHGPDRAGFRRTDTDSDNKATTTLHIGNVERVTHPDATVTVRRRIGGVAIELDGTARGGCEADAVRYVLRDHLGSVDRLADASGAAAQSAGFTAWGARRNPDDWTELADAATRSFDACATTRGFTGHEMLDAVGAVHMNGRLYDPALGRFLRADPFVQFPKELQGHNRYSYALNNPLAFTDPSGHFIFTLAASAFIATTTAKIGLVTIVSTLAAAGFGDALLHGASFQQALLAGFASGVSAGAFSGIGTALQGQFGGTFAAGLSPAGFGLKALAHGTAGGIASALGGGRFGHGFASGGLAALGSGLNNSRFVGRPGFSPLRVAVGAAIGGTASRITGGKFANGALTGAFSQALNNERAEAARLEARIDQVVAAVAADYGDVLEAGNIDLKANIKEARKIGFWKFVNRVRPGRDWDYKAHINAEAAGLDPSRIAEFGNLHYGIIAAARGYSLQFALSGAGGAQYFLQEGGSLLEFVGPYAAPLALAPSSLTAMNPQGADPIWYPMLSKEGAIRWMQSGGTFGDLPEDNYFVRRGWDLYHGK
ncbi:MAG: polymorphic toxin type 44 domain-containing protein [Gammaproteobacteria bacterium]|nr:polymorphic toxin type 44 domain-containing protein [Gammaproteobacteria bacterium]